MDDGFVDISLDGETGGLLKKILVEGKGENPPVGSSVKVHYVGTLHSDGSKFDSSRDRPGFFTFDVGVGQVIKGWDTGICTMQIGEKCILRCRSDYAYGDDGSPPDIPGGATLNFEVELFSFKEKVRPPKEMTIAECSAHAQKMKDKGTEAFKAQDWMAAVECYEDGVEYITYHPSKADSGDGDDAQSDKEQGEVLELNDEGTNIYVSDKTLALALLNNCAMAKLKSGQAAEAKADCTMTLMLDPDNVKALFRRAQSEVAMGDLAAAQRDTARIVEIDPQNKEALLLHRKCADDEKRAKQKEKAMYSKMFG